MRVHIGANSLRRFLCSAYTQSFDRHVVRCRFYKLAGTPLPEFDLPGGPGCDLSWPPIHPSHAPFPCPVEFLSARRGSQFVGLALMGGTKPRTSDVREMFLHEGLHLDWMRQPAAATCILFGRACLLDVYSRTPLPS